MLFRRRRRSTPSPQMGDHEPLPIADRDEALGRVAETFWNEPVEARNEFANRLLAWAETEDPDTFDAMKRLVIDTEAAVDVEEWRQTDPTVDAEAALDELRQLIVTMVKDVAEPGADRSNYHANLGPDIPLIVRELTVKLQETRDASE